MKSMRAALLTAVVLGLSAGRAAAGPVIVDGGPASAAGKKRLVAALAATGDLAVCFRAGPARVRVELRVAADGRIEKSTAQGGGAAGQCAAGVLAVQRLPAESGGYRAVVNLDGASAGTAARSQESIDADLAGLRGELDACQARDRTRSGEVALAFLIKPDGALADIKVSSSTLASPAIEKCLVGVLQAASLSARPGARTVAYTLSMALAGGGSGSAAPPASTGGGLAPQKDGPLAAALIQKAIRARQGAIDACYRAQAARNPKLAGTVTIRFSVYGDGKTYNASVKESTLASPAVEACLVKVFAALRFPVEPARAKTRVFYPLRFGAQ